MIAQCFVFFGRNDLEKQCCPDELREKGPGVPCSHIAAWSPCLSVMTTQLASHLPSTVWAEGVLHQCWGATERPVLTFQQPGMLSVMVTLRHSSLKRTITLPDITSKVWGAFPKHLSLLL